MPPVSQAQSRAMYAAREGKSSLGIPASVGREFTEDQSPGSVKRLPERVGPRDHALSMASATHLHNAGHITSAHRDRIHAAARDGISAGKAKAPNVSAPMGWAPDRDRDGV